MKNCGRSSWEWGCEHHQEHPNPTHALPSHTEEHSLLEFWDWNSPCSTAAPQALWEHIPRAGSDLGHPKMMQISERGQGRRAGLRPGSSWGCLQEDGIPLAGMLGAGEGLGCCLGSLPMGMQFPLGAACGILALGNSTCVIPCTPTLLPSWLHFESRVWDRSRYLEGALTGRLPWRGLRGSAWSRDAVTGAHWPRGTVTTVTITLGDVLRLQTSSPSQAPSSAHNGPVFQAQHG